MRVKVLKTKEKKSTVNILEWALYVVTYTFVSILKMKERFNSVKHCISTSICMSKKERKKKENVKPVNF